MAIISTISDKCQRCYACVRKCPVKAIKVERGRAKVIEDRCIACGSCVKVCAQGAKRVSSDNSKVEYYLATERQVVAILAPSFPASFSPCGPEQVVEGLFKLGFTDVEEVSLGVQLTIPEYKTLMKNTEQPIISSYCPAVVSLIEKHYPSLIELLAPIDSAVVATGKYIKQYRKKAKVVFVGPCIAKKEEAHFRGRGYVDAVLTFSELKEMFRNRDIEIGQIKGSEKIQHGDCVRLFPLPAGLLANLGCHSSVFEPDYVSIEGSRDCVEALKNLQEGTIKPRFADILFCHGCIDGPDIDSPLDLVSRKGVIAEYAKTCNIAPKVTAEGLNLKTCFVDRHVPYAVPTEQEIVDILKLTYKVNPEDQLNCGSCGYDTCRENAVAAFQGLAEADMCLPYLLHKSRGEIEYYKSRSQGRVPENGINMIIGEGEQIKGIKTLVERAAVTDSTVLIQGDSGVGKEVIAQAIHNMSTRRNKPFVGVNCAALPELLLESELFGYEDGAFTGARKGGKPGRFDLASGGTILLDEIGDMPLNMQAKLLRVLQEKTFERIGGTKSVPMDARVLVATNKPLKTLVQKGKFRTDLYYRLNVLNINIPPLKDRVEDIPLLLGHFIEKMSISKHMQPKIVSDQAMDAIMGYEWPGNVRELENVTERAMTICDGNVILPEHLPVHIRLGSGKAVMREIKPLKDAVQELEKSLIVDALKVTNNNKVNAATLLGLPRATLYQKLKLYGIS